MKKTIYLLAAFAFLPVFLLAQDEKAQLEKERQDIQKEIKEIQSEFDIGDVKAMGQQAVKILRDNEVLKQFKVRAAAHARKFDISNIIPLYENLYEKFL